MTDLLIGRSVGPSHIVSLTHQEQSCSLQLVRATCVQHCRSVGPSHLVRPTCVPDESDSFLMSQTHQERRWHGPIAVVNSFVDCKDGLAPPRRPNHPPHPPPLLAASTAASSAASTAASSSTRRLYCRLILILLLYLLLLLHPPPLLVALSGTYASVHIASGREHVRGDAVANGRWVL